MNYKLYCDLDGVLVNFDKGYLDLTGETCEEANNKGEEHFWKPINQAGSKYWEDLEWMSDGKILWNFIKPFNPKLLSAPSKENSSEMGKQIWVDENLGSKYDLILRPANKKHEFASPNSILIDDRESNINDWRNAGGIGILHKSAEETISQLKDIIKMDKNKISLTSLAVDVINEISPNSSFTTKEKNHNDETGAVTWDVKYEPNLPELDKNLAEMVEDFLFMKKHYNDDESTKLYNKIKELQKDFRRFKRVN